MWSVYYVREYDLPIYAAISNSRFLTFYVVQYNKIEKLYTAIGI